jgi:hypothetical protein
MSGAQQSRNVVASGKRMMGPMRTKTLLPALVAALVASCALAASSASAALPANQAQWIDGNISSASGLSCLGPIGGTLYEQQVGGFTGYWGKPDTTYPKVGDLYWGHVYYQSLGLGCGLGIHGVQVEVNLPAGTQLAIDPASTDPAMKLRCFGTNTQNQTSNLTDQPWQHPSNPTIKGKYCESTKTYTGGNGTILSYALVGQGQSFELIFPLRSTKKLAGIAEPANASRMTASITDSAADSVAQPYQWNFVGDRPVEADCPANGPTAASSITNTTAHTKNFMCNWYRSGKASIELGEGASGPYQVSSQQYTVPNNTQGFTIDQDWNGMTPGTTYHWRLKFVDDKGTPNSPGDDQTYYSADKTFTTTGTRPTTPPTTPPGPGNGGTQTGNGGQTGTGGQQTPGNDTPGGQTPNGGGDTGQQQLDQKQDQQQQQQQDQQQNPPKDGLAPVLTATVGKVKLGDVLKKGLSAAASCNEACSVRAQLQVDAKTAKKLKLGKVATVIGSGNASASGAGKLTVPVKLTAKAKKALKKQKSLKATLILSGTDSAGNAAKPVSKTVTLKR